MTAISVRKFVTREQAAEHFAISPRTLDKLIKAGTVRAYKIGRRGVRIDLAEAEIAILKREAGISE